MVPWDKGFPDYLEPEAHPQSNNLKKDYPTWMPKKKVFDPDKPLLARTPLPPRDNKDLVDRAARISEAAIRGTREAERRSIKVSTFKGHQRDQ
jgi:hypothetical protein